MERLSGHIWASANVGSPTVLDGLRYEHRAGVSHVEDLPPAGGSVTALAFDVSSLAAADVIEAQLDLTATSVEGVAAFLKHEATLGRRAFLVGGPAGESVDTTGLERYGRDRFPAADGLPVARKAMITGKGGSPCDAPYGWCRGWRWW